MLSHLGHKNNGISAVAKIYVDKRIHNKDIVTKKPHSHEQGFPKKFFFYNEYPVCTKREN